MAKYTFSKTAAVAAVVVAASCASMAQADLMDTCMGVVNNCQQQCNNAGVLTRNATCQGANAQCQCEWSAALAKQNTTFCAQQRNSCAALCSTTSGAPNGTTIDSFTCDGNTGSSWCQCAMAWNQWDSVRSYWRNGTLCTQQRQQCFNNTCRGKSNVRFACSSPDNFKCDCDGHPDSTWSPNATVPSPSPTATPTPTATGPDGAALSARACFSAAAAAAALALAALLQV